MHSECNDNKREKKKVHILPAFVPKCDYFYNISYSNVTEHLE